jgi:hypothetical protein
MNDRLLIHRDSPEGLYRTNYCNEVHGFINYALSNSRNISGAIRGSCKRCENKKFLDPNVVTMHLIQKGFMERYQCWFTHGKPYVPHETIVEKIVGSTSSSSNVHEVVYDNSNPYRNMVIDAMRMNQGYVSECPIVDEEPNADATTFFDFLKYSNKPLWDRCTSHCKLSIITQVFIINSDYGLSEADYDKIVK